MECENVRNFVANRGIRSGQKIGEMRRDMQFIVVNDTKLYPANI